MYEDGLFHFKDYGVFVFNGPNWDQDLQTICDNFDEDICEYAAHFGYGEPVSVQTIVHWKQNTLQQRY